MLLLKLTLTSGIPTMDCCIPSMEHQSLDLSSYLLSTVCFPLENQRERERGKKEKDETNVLLYNFLQMIPLQMRGQYLV